MKNKVFAALIVCAFFLYVGSATSADTNVVKKGQTAALAALLPASDGIMTIDMQKVLSETAPQILSGKPQTLAGINAKIDEVKEKTGIDLRQFEQIAVGVSTKQISAKEIDLEPLILARGTYNANALIALAKLASKGKFREEKVGTRSIYVFSGSAIAPSAKPVPTVQSAKQDWFGRMIDRTIAGLMKEIAVTSYDGNTLAVGSPARVRDTLNIKTPVNAELLTSVNRQPNAVVAFSANLPKNLSNYINLDNDQFSATLDSIRQASGAMELVNGDTAVSFTAKTGTADQSKNLLETLQGLQMIGKTILGSSKGADKQVYARMIDNAKITRSQLEVALDLQVPQTDINILIGAK